MIRDSRKPENIRKWVDALRSGQYQQTQHHLADDEGYCCLGVACEVAIANGLRLKRKDSDYSVTYAGERDTLPISVQRWLGIMDEDGNPRLGPDSCVEQNDKGKSFAEIAEMIETEYLSREAL